MLSVLFGNLLHQMEHSALNKSTINTQVHVRQLKEFDVTLTDEGTLLAILHYRTVVDQ